MAYLDLAGFRLLSLMPASDIDAIELAAPGWIDAQLDDRSDWIDAQLRKLYAVPFSAPAPKVVRGWLARIVTKRAYLRRGVDATDSEFVEIAKDADVAEAEVAAASDGNGAKWDLPLRADTTATGISKGGPYAYSEQSPYVAFDRQGATARDEDSWRSGSGD